MNWRFAFGFIPVPVFYVAWGWLIGGFTPCVCIFMLPIYRTDEGLHRHELLHAEQAWKMLLLPYALLYLLWPAFRLKMEIAGYREQFKWPSANGGPPLTPAEAARFLATDYRLGITEDEARALLG